MVPHAGITPHRHAPGTRPRRERIEVLIIVPFYDEAPVLSYCLQILQLDEQLFVFLNSLGSERWDGFWLFVTNKFSWIPFYVALVYLLHRHFGLKNMMIIIILIVVMITMTDQLANLFKHGFERPRPCRQEHLKEIIRYIAPRCGRYGFFSAHAASSMALTVFLGLLFGKTYRHLVFLLLSWASIVGFSRIYVGVHYPLDTLTGMVIGAMAGFLIYGVSQRFELSDLSNERVCQTNYATSNHPIGRMVHGKHQLASQRGPAADQ